MIRLFICDIDGCLAMPYASMDLVRLARLKALAEQADPEAGRPEISLCSGRSYAYVEAVTQLLGLRVPVLFESGGGLFHLPTASIRWNPAFDEEVEAQVEAAGAWLRAHVGARSRMAYDYGKRTQASIVGPDPAEVARFVPDAEAHVAQHYPDLHAFHTHASIDIVPQALTKRRAMDWLAEETGVGLDAMAFIGDTNGDLPALEAVGRSYAPANAAPSVRARVTRVTDGAVADGVLEAYAECVAHNGGEMPEALAGSR